MKSVLLVDDEPHIIAALTRHVGWEKLGLRIAGTAANGLQALASYRELKPDLVITDVNMPQMNGLALVEALRQEDAGLPIVILSGFDEFENARQAMRWGVHHFLLKPAAVAEIEGVLAEIMGELDLQAEKLRLEEHYKLELDRLLPYLRERLFTELLTTRYQPHELHEERLAYLNIPSPKQVAALSLQLTRPALLTKLKERDWQLLKFGANNIIREMLEGKLAGTQIYGYAIDYSDRLFVLVLLSEQAQEDELYQACEELAYSLTEKITALLKLEATAGIGSVRSSLHELIDSYLESRVALEAAEFQGTSQVYPYAEWAQLDTTYDQYAPLLKQWNEALTDKDLERAAHQWEAIHNQLQKEASGSLTDIQTICVGLFSSLTFFWNEAFAQHQPPRTLSQFLQGIQQHLTLGALARWMNELVEEWLQSAAQEISGRKSNRLVDSVKQYVAANFSQEISFAAIAKELFVHPKYLSQLFKRVTGQNFVHYLNDYRIHKAIDYLQSGHHMVYEVSEMVGFNNPTYFSQVFKMSTGKSPSDYFRM